MPATPARSRVQPTSAVALFSQHQEGSSSREGVGLHSLRKAPVASSPPLGKWLMRLPDRRLQGIERGRSIGHLLQPRSQIERPSASSPGSSSTMSTPDAISPAPAYRDRSARRPAPGPDSRYARSARNRPAPPAGPVPRDRPARCSARPPVHADRLAVIRRRALRTQPADRPLTDHSDKASITWAVVTRNRCNSAMALQARPSAMLDSTRWPA